MKLWVFILWATVVLSASAAEEEKLPENYDSIIKDAADPSKLDSVFEWSEGLDTWEAPEELKKALPYYIMGYDYEHRPVMVLEWGRWDSRKYVDAGGDTYKNFDKYFEQFWYRLERQNSTHPEADDGVDLIIDAAEFSVRQLASVEVVRNQLIQARRGEKVEPRIVHMWIVNMNFIAQTWTSLIRPVAGRFLGKAELHGVSKEKYAAALAEKIPQDQLPEWYGGSKDYKPAKVY